jgi:hypothetical protein
MNLTRFFRFYFQQSKLVLYFFQYRYLSNEEEDSWLILFLPCQISLRKPEEIDELLAQIYGPSHTRSSALALHSSK